MMWCVLMGYEVIGRAMGECAQPYHASALHGQLALLPDLQLVIFLWMRLELALTCPYKKWLAE